MPATDDIWTVKATLDWMEGYLERHGDEHPRQSAQWLLSEVTGLSRIQLFMNFDRALTMAERDVLRGYVTRRGKGEPLQYITGEVGFRHITVKVRLGVLIPRPETEVLVSEALALLPAPEKVVAADSLLNEYDGAALLAARAEELNARQSDRPASATTAEAAEDDDESAVPVEEEHRFGRSGTFAEEPAENVVGAAAGAVDDDAAGGLAGWLAACGFAMPAADALLVADICTGSGCIACSVAYEHPQTRVFATDIASECVALARENATALGLGDRIVVLQGDLGDALPAEALGHLDLIVSNPPYVPTAVMAQLSPEVADFEPALALDGGADGLDVFRRLLDVCGRALRPGGGFAFELHEDCLDEAAYLAREAGFVGVRIVRDLVDKPRVLTGRRSAEGLA